MQSDKGCRACFFGFLTKDPFSEKKGEIYYQTFTGTELVIVRLTNPLPPFMRLLRLISFDKIKNLKRSSITVIGLSEIERELAGVKKLGDFDSGFFKFKNNPFSFKDDSGLFFKLDYCFLRLHSSLSSWSWKRGKNLWFTAEQIDPLFGKKKFSECSVEHFLIEWEYFPIRSIVWSETLERENGTEYQEDDD